MRSFIREYIPSVEIKQKIKNEYNDINGYSINDKTNDKFQNSHLTINIEDTNYSNNNNNNNNNFDIENIKDYNDLKFNEVSNILKFNPNNTDKDFSITSQCQGNRKLTSMKNSENNPKSNKINIKENNILTDKISHHEKKESFNYNYNSVNSQNQMDQEKIDSISDFILKSQNELKFEKQAKSNRKDQCKNLDKDQLINTSNLSSKDTIFDNHDKLKFSENNSSNENLPSSNNSMKSQNSDSKKPMYLFYRTPSNKDGKKNISFDNK